MAVLAPARLSLAAWGGDNLHSLDFDDRPSEDATILDSTTTTTATEHLCTSPNGTASFSPLTSSSSWNWTTSKLFAAAAPKKPAGARLPIFAGRRRQYRSLTDSEPVLRAMAAVHEDSYSLDTAPSSPPELSYSKSSKSSDSSIHSSSLSDLESSEEKLSHFEDIAIEEHSRSSEDDSNLRPEKRPTLRRPPLRSTSASAAKGLGLLTTGAIRQDRISSLPNGQPYRGRFANPSSPSLLMHSPRHIVSRSPSPTKPLAQGEYVTSPRSAGTLTPRASLDPKSPGDTLSRHDTWQPRRKSVRELEAECDDNDEDVPDEAILENVPISPMPGQPKMLGRKSPSPGPPPRSPSYGNLHSANVPRKGRRPSAPSMAPNIRRPSRSPQNIRPRMLPHSASVPSFHGEPFNRSHRSKSWTEDLNDEAKQLSAELELHAEQLDTQRHVSAPGSAANSPPRPGLSAQRRTKTMMDFPPVQKGHMMIDPFPISKEKEAVLTRTRPSWLPPKDPREEKRHMREWEQMMAKAVEVEKKRQSREKEEKEEKKEQQDSIDRIWDQHVLPNWDTVIHEPRTRELWWRGVTPRSRGVVWQKALGNDLTLTAGSFEAALNRAHEMEESIAEMSEDERSTTKEAAWFDAIDRDVPMAFKQAVPQGLQNALTDVLKAYAMYRSDVGYVYGIHLPAGILCRHMRPADAFVALANMLNRPLPMAFLIHDSAAMERAYDLVLGALKYKFSKLHGHLTSSTTGLKPEEYLDPLLRCLFAYNLPTAQVCRIWDIFVFEGDKALIRSAVAVLGKLESKLYGTKDEVLDVISWRNEQNWNFGSDDDLINAVREAGKVDGKAAARRS
ncbi:hypothetical protein K431DRAFT_280782 [Polychaeton citri CBS 116435]|uniref:Rab-GAP TBC domain-containing protein n=1 Tax=Polychaeton citri CBS 116435 TaxID=1314669 RepID=A0A9P4QFE7_9PEZI|nr:hypothetical protein K431DRAFT_280782 [Polychaeton citri CBS 116435]